MQKIRTPTEDFLRQLNLPRQPAKLYGKAVEHKTNWLLENGDMLLRLGGILLVAFIILFGCAHLMR